MGSRSGPSEQISADLLEHASVLATINLYVILGSGELADVSRFDRVRFERLCGFTTASEGGDAG